MKEDVEDFKTRFNKALSIRNIKPSVLSEKTGISKSTISHYMSGYTKPKSDKLFILAKALNVDESWLMGLNTSMEREQIISHVTPELIERNKEMDEALLYIAAKFFSRYGKDEIIDYINQESLPNNIKADIYNQLIHHLKYNPSDHKVEIYPLLDVLDLDMPPQSKELELINKYHSLDEKGKHTVDTVLEMEYNRCKDNCSEESMIKPKEDKSHLLPMAAHNDTITEPEELEKTIRDLAKLKRPKK